MNDEKFGSRKFSNWNTAGGRNSSDFLQNWFPPENRVRSLLNLLKFQDFQKNAPESFRMY